MNTNVDTSVTTQTSSQFATQEFYIKAKVVTLLKSYIYYVQLSGIISIFMI